MSQGTRSPLLRTVVYSVIITGVLVGFQLREDIYGWLYRLNYDLNELVEPHRTFPEQIVVANQMATKIFLHPKPLNENIELSIGYDPTRPMYPEEATHDPDQRFRLVDYYHHRGEAFQYVEDLWGHCDSCAVMLHRSDVCTWRFDSHDTPYYHGPSLYFHYHPKFGKVLVQAYYVNLPDSILVQFGDIMRQPESLEARVEKMTRLVSGQSFTINGPPRQYVY